MVHTDTLIVVRPEHVPRYRDQLSIHSQFRLTFATTIPDALTTLADVDQHVDVLVLDNELENAFETVSSLRQSHSRLLIVLVDEGADFALPGQADDISTDPFNEDDLARRIDRLLSERRLETLRADTMPPVRDFAKRLRKAGGEAGKEQAAVAACRDLGYDYAAFYKLESLEPLVVTLKAQDGSALYQVSAPKTASEDDIMGWVAKTGQSRLAAPGDEVNHPLVTAGKLGAVACAPVGSTNRSGVLVACRVQPGSITQQQLLLLELVSAQLAAVVSKG